MSEPWEGIGNGEMFLVRKDEDSPRFVAYRVNDMVLMSPTVVRALGDPATVLGLKVVPDSYCSSMPVEDVPPDDDEIRRLVRELEGEPAAVRMPYRMSYGRTSVLGIPIQYGPVLEVVAYPTQPTALDLLVEAEWVSHETDEGSTPEQCPWCEGSTDHAEFCRWVALMRREGKR